VHRRADPIVDWTEDQRSWFSDEDVT